MPLYDAHLHLQNPLLKAVAASPLPLKKETGVVAAQVTNGTHPDDWESVSALSGDEQTCVLKAYGVHPWKVDALPPDWQGLLRQYLERDAVAVGEIGLDHWIEPRDERRQKDIFCQQIELAEAYNLPIVIHCLRAWGDLLKILKLLKPSHGFLVHAFSGSLETLDELLDMGGYVSFSAYAMDSNRKRMREAIKACPKERILVETDAPDMLPPEAFSQYPLYSENGDRVHHPAELHTAYRFLADFRNEPLPEFIDQVEQNFQRLFVPKK